MNKLWRNIALCLLIIALFVMPISAVENMEVTKDSVLEESNVNASGQKDEVCRTDIISFSQPLLSVKGDYITVDIGESTSSTMGKDTPALPIVTKTYTFPFNTQVKDVEISYSKNKKEILTKPIMPAPEPQIVSTAYTSNNIIKNEDETMYADIEKFPEQRSTYRIGAGLKDGQRIKFLTVHLYPIQYNPTSNLIYHADSATVHITYLPSKNPFSFPDVYDLLIITPAEFTDELQPLVDYKNEHEIPTIMVTLDDIPEMGVDQQEDIKYYIKDAIETWGITYVLLVGNGVRGKEKFPVRYAYCLPYKVSPDPVEFPSDLYYADIYNSGDDFSSWNSDGDDRYFEYPTDLDAVDIYPDVYLGRLPCNNANEVKTVVSKILGYMENNKMTKKILQIGGDMYIYNDGISEGEFANEEVLKKLSDYTTTRLWGSLDNLKKLNIRKGFMDGVDFVDINGHGGPTIIGTFPPNDDDTFIPPRSLLSPFPGFLSFDYDLFFFNNEKLPVIVYTACLCSRFTDVPNCIGWKPISKSKGGGIASFGYTTSTWSLGGVDATDRYAHWNEVKIFDEMHDNKILGMSWGNCITDYMNSFNLDALDLAVLPSFAFFGDPTLSIENDKDSIKTQASELNVWSDNFDSYESMQLLDGTPNDNGWQCYPNNTERGAYVVDDYSRSLPHSVEINGQAHIMHEFTGLNSGNLTFRDWVYVPSGSDVGESEIGFLSYYYPDHYCSDYFISDGCFFQFIITLDINNGLIKNRAHPESLPLILDKWIELRVEIDLESDWVECFYNDELLMAQTWTNDWLGRDGFLNCASVNLWGHPEEDCSVYHDDMSIYYEGTGLNPDLQCEGSLSLTCKAGKMASDTFTIQNIGDSDSRLEWMIYDVPDYGTGSWCLFDCLTGILTPQDGEFTVTVTLKAPNKIGDHVGVIKIHAVGDSSEHCEIPVTLTVTKKSREIHSSILQFLENHPHLFPILRQTLLHLG